MSHRKEKVSFTEFQVDHFFKAIYTKGSISEEDCLNLMCSVRWGWNILFHALWNIWINETRTSLTDKKDTSENKYGTLGKININWDNRPQKCLH